MLSDVSVRNIRTDIPEGSKIIFEKEFLIVGEKYECRKNRNKKRLDIINKTRIGSPVHIEKYIYDGNPAYMIVNTEIGLDLGVLSSDAASWLTSYYSRGKTAAVLTDRFKDSFHVNVFVYEKYSKGGNIMKCPKCGSENVNAQVINEVTFKDKHHGIIWWIFIGWWWIFVKWLFFTIPAIIVKIFAPKKQKAVNKSTTKCVCQNCGNTWNA